LAKSGLTKTLSALVWRGAVQEIPKVCNHKSPQARCGLSASNPWHRSHLLEKGRAAVHVVRCCRR